MWLIPRMLQGGVCCITYDKYVSKLVRPSDGIKIQVATAGQPSEENLRKKEKTLSLFLLHLIIRIRTRTRRRVRSDFHGGTEKDNYLYIDIQIINTERTS